MKQLVPIVNSIKVRKLAQSRLRFISSLGFCATLIPFMALFLPIRTVIMFYSAYTEVYICF